MKNQLASIEIHYLVKEFQILINSRVDKIFQMDKKNFYFSFHVPKIGKKLLRITDKLIYFVDLKPEVPAAGGFCLFLRKNLDNSRLRGISQKESERIIEFIFETKGGFKKLIIELFGGGNVILLDSSNIILSAAHYEKYKQRDILAKKEYKYPKMEYNFLNLKNIKGMFTNSNKDNIVKSLAVDLGLGGVYSEEVCLLAKVDKNEKPIDFDGIKKIEEAVKKLIKKKIDARIVYDKEAKDVIPFKLDYYKDLEGKKFESFNQALEYYFSKEFKEEKKVKSAYQKKLDEIERIISEQKMTLKGLEKGEVENRGKAELIYNKYSEIKEILEELKKAKKKYSWEEIMEKLKGHKVIKEVNSKEGKVVVEL